MIDKLLKFSFALVAASIAAVMSGSLALIIGAFLFSADPAVTPFPGDLILALAFFLLGLFVFGPLQIVLAWRGKSGRIGHQAQRNGLLECAFPRLRWCAEESMHEVAGQSLAHKRLTEGVAIATSRVAEAVMSLMRDLAAQRALTERGGKVRIAGIQAERERGGSMAVPDHAEFRNDFGRRRMLDLDRQLRGLDQPRDGRSGSLDVLLDRSAPARQLRG